ncbi:hypothetical protein E2R68_10975 [Psychromonas sp. RZ22]|uniref:uroporphyrinogen-III C-methyltransferase n=1 Tax=Psychromonas algarum TaxID=2555643 RepID=UPI001068B3F4|nr:uroporphyrinogen-III C-methyltransferase [Psychromonas sp. RZ22]TEW53999.1 hypothetical protein E2R68_10975 [Psychromonas sp. RZ22]
MTDTNIETPESSATAKSKDVSSKKHFKVLITTILIFVVLLLCIAGLSFYLYQGTLSSSAAYQKKIDNLSVQLESQANLQDKQYNESKLLNDRLNTQVEQLNIQLLDIKNKNKLYSSDIQTLQRNLAETNVRHPSDWILSEVEYLINLSGRKLWLEHDVRTSVSLLQTADLRLVEMGDPSLNPLRRALLEDLNVLEALPKRDVDGVVLALSSLERRIDKLTISGLELSQTSENDELNVSEDMGDWKSNLDKSWHSFVESFIVITHRDAPVEALLSPEQSWYLKENLRNDLSKAEFAIYREQQDIYDLALENALQLINNYYDMSDTNTQQFYNSLQKLSKQKVSISYPDQFKSAPLLARIMKQRINKSLIIEEAE